MPPRHTRLHATVSALPAGSVAGEDIFHELPRQIALHAMRVYRSVMLWAEVPFGERSSSIFTEGAMASLAISIEAGSRDLGDAFSQPLILIACELSRDEPDVRRIAIACLAVTDWALARRASVTATAFADAAAIVYPNARFALISGRLHRQCGNPREAEQWLRKASLLASSVGDWLTKTRALLSLGSASLSVGKYGRAEAYFQEGLRFAVRHRVRELVGEAWHDLFTVAISTNNHKAAENALKEAVRRYRRGHHRLPAFAHDLAAYWIERGDFENARTVLLTLLEKYWLNDPPLRLLAYSTTLRALGGCGQAEEFDKVIGEFWALANKVGETRWLAPSLLSAGRGAVSLKRWRLAETLLSDSAEQARKTGQHDTVMQAERLLALARDKRDEPRQVSNSRINRDVARTTVLALGGDNTRP